MAIHGVRRNLVLAPRRVTWTLRPSTLRLLCNCVSLGFTSLSKSSPSLRNTYLLLHQVENLVGFLIWLKDFERFGSFEIQTIAFPLRFLYQVGINFDARVKADDLWMRGHGKQEEWAGEGEGGVKIELDSSPVSQYLRAAVSTFYLCSPLVWRRLLH